VLNKNILDLTSQPIYYKLKMYSTRWLVASKNTELGINRENDVKIAGRSTAIDAGSELRLNNQQAVPHKRLLEVPG
jgi:hypothetical protein